MYLLHLLAFTLLLLPTVVWGATTAEEAAAQSFVPLVGIPYIEGEKVATFGDYVNAFYYASISIAAFLAVIRIIFAGVKYMLSDIVSSKQDAKKDIRSALFGLLIVVGAVLILNTINTNLTNIRLFADAPMPRMTGDPGRVNPGAKTCETHPDSAECCLSEGGTPYAVTTTESGFICSKGETIDDETYDTGDTFDDRFLCERDGNDWNEVANTCQQPGEALIPIPSSYTSESEKRMYCSGINARYDEERSICIMRE